MRRAHCSLHLSPSPACPGSPLNTRLTKLPLPTPVREMCPRSAGFRLGGGRGPLFSILLLRPSSRPPQSVSTLASWSASSLQKARCSLLPSDRSSHCGGLFRDPLSPTRIPAVPLPERANPGPSLSHPLSRGARGEPREQTQQIAERESAEPAPSARRPPPRPAPVAQTPALRAQLSRPFRCSSQDGGRRAASGEPPRLPGPLSVHFPSRGPPQEARRRAARPRTSLRTRRGEDKIPADPNGPQPRRLRGWECKEGRPGRDLADPLDPRRFPWADTPPDSWVWTLLPNLQSTGVSPPPALFRGRARSPGRGS